MVEPSKPNVPCYFFFNAYCIKGDQCPFLHEITQKISKTAPEPTPSNPPQTKTSTGSDTGPASVEVPATTNPSESTSELVKQSHSKEVQEPAPGSVSEESSPSSESSARECEELGIKMCDSPLPPVEYINGSNEHPSQDPSSDEPDKDMVEHDEWWESSPGFDVLVDDGSEQLAYPDDAEYLLAQERESEMLHHHLLQYDFEDSAGYDPMGYPNVGYDPYERLEGRHTPEYFEKDFEQSREMFLEPIIHWKRKGPHNDCGEGVRGGADLRDLLRKRRRVDVHHASHSSLKHCPSQARGNSRERSVRRASQARGNSRERPVRRGMGPRLRGRLSSEVGTSMIGSSHGESESLWNDRHRRGWSGYPHLDRYDQTRHREKESRRRRAKSPPIHSEFSQSSASKDVKSRLVTATGFNGPKTLEQIREEKRAKADTDVTGSCDPRPPRRTVSDDFEGPKPLNELLKNKRKPASGIANPSSQAGKGVADAEDNLLSYHGTAEKLDREYDSDFLDDDEDFDLS